MNTKESRSWVAWLTIIAFLWGLQVYALPQDRSGAAAADHESSVTRAATDEDAAGVVEKSTGKDQKANKRHFPWLLVGAGVVLAAAAAYYFLVYQKKEFTLTVVLGDGVTGSPDAGETKYKRGSNVNYSYSLSPGYRNLKVTLDGAEVAASGTIAMKKNHRLEAVAVKEVELTVTIDAGVNGTPVSGTYTYLTGDLVTYSYSLKTGFTNLEVKLDGAAVSPGGTITMNTDHTLTASTVGQRKLTVTRSAGVNGTPGTGTFSYTNGTVVNYSYTAKLGYYYFVVYLDGTPVVPIGSITMNADHTLVANAVNALQLEWLLNGNAQDTSGKGRHGTPFNVSTITGHKGVAATALYFNGTTAYVEGPNFISHDNKCVSISLWMKTPASTGSIQYLVMTNGFAVSQSGTSIYMSVSVPGTSSASCSVPLNTWTHIAGTYDGTTIRIYRNGTLMSSTPHAGTPSNPDRNFTLARFGATYWKGYIDDVRVYSYKLSDTEIQTLAGM